jgi:chaperonin GroES
MSTRGSATTAKRGAVKETMSRTYQPMGDRVLVKPIERDEVSKGGIILPDTAKEKSQEGEIIAAGPGRLTDEGKRIPMEVKKGDLILYAKYGGTELKEDGEDYLILTERDILAKITK